MPLSYDNDFGPLRFPTPFQFSTGNGLDRQKRILVFDLVFCYTNGMKCFGYLMMALGLAVVSLVAEEPVTVTADSQSRRYEIPADFAGISIFTGTQVRDH